MGLKYLFDTNVFIGQIINDPKSSEFFSETFLNNNQVLTSQIVRLELLSYGELTHETEYAIINLLKQFEVVNIDSEIESKTIEIRRRYKLKLPDAIIAATAIVEGAALITFNSKDFKKIRELDIN